MVDSEIPTIKIKVQNILGKSLTLPTDGQKLYDLIYFLVQDKKIVELDFLGVHYITSAFLNYSVGHLLKDCDRSQIQFTGLSKIQKTLVKNVIDNAVSHYKQQSN